MDRRTKVKMIIGLIIVISWIVLISGIIHLPAFIWFLLIIITFIFYIGSTGYKFRRKKSPEDIFEDMEEYMERKTEKRLGKPENSESQEEEDKEEYEFDDDIMIIKK